MKDVTGLDKRAMEIENLEATRTGQVHRVVMSAGTNAIEENTPNLHRQWMLLKRKEIKKKSSVEVGNVHDEQNKHLSTRSHFTVLEADGNRVTLTPEHDPFNIDSMDITNDGHAPNVQASISAEHSQAWKSPTRLDSDLSNELPNANDVTATVWRDKMGNGKVKWASTIKDFKKIYANDVFVVLEPRISGSKSLNVIAHASQSITALFHVQNKCWLLTVVYANPNPRIRESLWTYFESPAKSSNLSWLVMGDFNGISCASEKYGGNFYSEGSAFVDWIDCNHLIDLSFSGSKFTWCNKRNAEGIMWKRIDRGLSNSVWHLLFLEAHLSHLPKNNLITALS
ncbi:hypothetical protein OIU79_025355 [Salix purpurea]|uniref:Uncharacterized protein n=1 Tax=Salix purpurea TaxID=77065 RepID=A0A9Q0W7K8_SALPP|nr:hypothetical protein OIU79_025355 [Salix purpurea]